MATRALRLVRRPEPEFEGDVLQGLGYGIAFSLICWAVIGYALWRIF